MVKVYSIFKRIQTVTDMKDNLKMIKQMVKVFYIIKMVIDLKDFGKITIIRQGPTTIYQMDNIQNIILEMRAIIMIMLMIRSNIILLRIVIKILKLYKMNIVLILHSKFSNQQIVNILDLK
jgi:hypothetical protein